MNWYALYTKPQCERAVHERLLAKGFETYLPAIIVNSRRQGTLTLPFFPGYLFVRVDPDVDTLSRIRWTPGLKHIVSFDGKPAVVPDEVIALIRERLAILGHGDGLRQGDKEIRNPKSEIRNWVVSLSPLEALFEEALDPAERTWLLLRFLDQTNSLQVAMEGLERVGADAGGSARKKGLRRTRGRGRRIRYVTADG